jgi:hypothetical protein
VTVRSSEVFDPEKQYNTRRAFAPSIEFADQGKTADPLLLWSGDKVLDLNRYRALKIVPRSIGGKDYLYIENDEFSTRQNPDWDPEWVVFAKE